MFKPKPYQQEVLNYLKGLRKIALFMKTGSGKTVTSLFHYLAHKTPNLLVIAPSNIVGSWLNTMDMMLPKYMTIWQPTNKKGMIRSTLNKSILENMPRKDVAIVVPIESINKLSSLKQVINPNWTIILDESHKIKDITTKRSKFIVELGDMIPENKMILSAYPSEKANGGFIDYYAQLRFLGVFPPSFTLSKFRSNYCIIEKISVKGVPFPISKVVGYRNIEQLKNLIKSFSVYVEVKYNEEPPLHLLIELPKPQGYNKMVREKYYEDLDLKNLTSRRIAYITACTGIINGCDEWKNPKYYLDNNIKIQWLKEYFESNNDKVLIFYNYNVELYQLQKLMIDLGKKFIVLNGKNKNKVNDINSGDYDVILGQYKACSESVDGIQYHLHTCIYFAIPESSMAYMQSLGRIDRIGQKKAPIYYYLVTSKTIESLIYERLINKIELNERVLESFVVDGSLVDTLNE